MQSIIRQKLGNIMFFFFFQAEDGIRDYKVTGVQTCALPISRMSGTAYGTVVLHVAPEAAVGGPLALVRNGDLISLDVEARTLVLQVSDAELARRRAEWKPPPKDRESVA